MAEKHTAIVLVAYENGKVAVVDSFQYVEDVDNYEVSRLEVHKLGNFFQELGTELITDMDEFLR